MHWTTPVPGSTASKECAILPAVSSTTLKDYRYYYSNVNNHRTQSTSTCTLARCIKYLYSSSGLVLNLMHMVQYVVYSGVL
jgi:hypothetical protein